MSMDGFVKVTAGSVEICLLRYNTFKETLDDYNSPKIRYFFMNRITEHQSSR